MPAKSLVAPAMLNAASGYVIAFVIFVAADMVWLGFMAPRFYRPILGDIAVSSVNLTPAIIFYAIFPIGLLIFAINPALKSESVAAALIYGALFGFFTYATYDLTNHATLRNWTWLLTVVDVAWGVLLGAITAMVTFWIVCKLGSPG